jgi:hypothetical protein
MKIPNFQNLINNIAHYLYYIFTIVNFVLPRINIDYLLQNLIIVF